jgi:F0F1-type ATP synthase membrane subunit b/b'
MFLQLDGTFLIQLINFAIFFALLAFVFIRPVSIAIRKRREYINSVTSDYDTYQAQAKSLREQAESVRSIARRDAEATMAQARADASNTAAGIATSYASKSQATIEQAAQTVAGEMEAARAQEPALVRQLAELMLERTISGGV